MLKYYYSAKSDRLLALHPSGDMEVFERCTEEKEEEDESEKPQKKKSTRAPKNEKSCCGSKGPRHKSDCNGQINEGKAKDMQGCPVDEETYDLVRQKKRDGMNVMEICEAFSVRPKIVGECLSTPTYEKLEEMYE